jgi:hypothetical protein
MTKAKLRGDAARDPRSWPGRWLDGLVAVLASTASGYGRAFSASRARFQLGIR